MKKLTLLALMIAPAIVSAQTPAFTLNGKITNIKSPLKVYLGYQHNGKKILDSAVVKNGTFQFNGNVNSPVMAQLVLDHKAVGIANIEKTADALSLFIDNSVITISAADSIKTGKITGSKINQQFETYLASFSVPEKAMDEVNREFSAVSKEKRQEPEYRKQMQDRYEKALDEKRAIQLQYIKANPSSYFSLIALTEIPGGASNIAKVEPLFKGLSADLRNSDKGKDYAAQIEAAKATSVGSTAPEFTQNDVNDKPVSLSSFRGKYVLVDFWASWCGPCRAENPNVVEAYNQFRDRNFTVLGVSLDSPGKKDAWLAAIEKDKLNWTQLSDLNGWQNTVAKLYGVRSIPQNYLIDPNGKIVGKNLRGEELHQKLKEVLGAGATK